MIQTIPNTLAYFNISGSLILYRDNTHKKVGLANYLRQQLSIDKQVILTRSGGAFAMCLALAYPEKKVVDVYKISDTYRNLLSGLGNYQNIGDQYQKYNAPINETSSKYIFLNQHLLDVAPSYYKQHFTNVIAPTITNHQIDCFVDCSHSGATLAGIYQIKKDQWSFILGVIQSEEQIPTTKRHLLQHVQYQAITTTHFNTVLIEEKCLLLDGVSDIFEATRSISAAFRWLQLNPGKTVLVYVGDGAVTIPEGHSLMIDHNIEDLTIEDIAMEGTYYDRNI